MAEYGVQRTPTGWVVLNGVVSLEAASPHVDRGVIRAAVTARQRDEIVYRDTANLTSEKSRRRIIARLAEKGVAIDDALIVALEDACRTRPAATEKHVCDGGSDFSEKVAPFTLAQLEAAFSRHLLITDRALLPVLVGATLAHQLGGESVWLLLVAPPGGTKSEVLRALYGYPGIYPLSSLTARTFASGLDVPGSEPSLLARLSDEIIVLKDLTTVLESAHEERQAIFAQLREIYDGRFDKAWGTGRELHWEGRLGFIAGVTPIIDRHHAALSVLGERFVLLRPVMPDRKQLATAALRAAGNEPEIRAELAAAMHGFLAHRSSDPPATDDVVFATLATVADFVTRARSGVIRDGYRRELEYAPEPEAPTRFAKVLHSLARGIALAYDSPAVTQRDLGLVLRVALDCLPVARQRLIAALVRQAMTSDEDGDLSTSALAGLAQFSTATIRRTLEDLQALEVVTCHKRGQGKADTWTLNAEWADVFVRLRDAMTTFSEKSEGVSHTTCQGCGAHVAPDVLDQQSICRDCRDWTPATQ